MDEKTFEVIVVFKSGAKVNFFCSDFAIQKGETGDNIYIWSSTPNQADWDLIDIFEDNIDAVIKREVQSKVERKPS